MLFELASVLSPLAKPNLVVTTPERYSMIRMHQLEATFGFESVVGSATPWQSLDGHKCRLSVVIGDAIVPPVPAFGKRSVYHIQFPFWISDELVEEGSAWLAGYDEIWVYSDFVRRNVNGLIRHYGLTAPPIRLIRASAAWSGSTAGLPWPERKMILAVGRFFAEGHEKRHDVTIEAYRRIVDQGTEGVDLALAGSIQPSPASRNRFLELQRLTAGINCTIHPNIARDDLASMYEQSAFLIHSTGFGIEPDEFPEKLEHSGIVPVEAASFGCIPVVYGEGAAREVLKVLDCDTSFSTIEECADIVSALLNDPRRSTGLSAHVRETSQAYSKEAFADGVHESLQELGVL
jgi:glycosyltransferase involved in cell wall biosynthesis